LIKRIEGTVVRATTSAQFGKHFNRTWGTTRNWIRQWEQSVSHRSLWTQL